MKYLQRAFLIGGLLNPSISTHTHTLSLSLSSIPSNFSIRAGMGEQLNIITPEHHHGHQIDHHLMHHSGPDLSMNLGSNSCGSGWSDDDLDLMGNIAAAMESALFTKIPSDVGQYCDADHNYDQQMGDYLNADDRYDAMDDHVELINGAADAIINGEDHYHNDTFNRGNRTIDDHLDDDTKQYDNESHNVGDLLAFARACLSTSSTNLITNPANYSSNQAAAAANPVVSHVANQDRMHTNKKKKPSTGSAITSSPSTTAGYKLSDFLGASRRIFKPIIRNNGYSNHNPAINNRFNLPSSQSSSNLLMATSSSSALKRSASMMTMNHGYNGSTRNSSDVDHDQAAAADDLLLQYTTHVVSESVRRKQMTRLFHTLRSLLPTKTPQHDRCTIIDETRNYIQTLERELKGLQKKLFVLETVERLLQSSASTARKACTKGDKLQLTQADGSKDDNKHDNHDHNNHASSVNRVKPRKTAEDMMSDNEELMKELEQEAPYIQVLGNYDGDNVISGEADQIKAEDPSSSSSPPSTLRASKLSPPSSVSISIGCHERKRGLFPTILHLVEQHNLEVISASQSHNNDIVLYAIYAKVRQPCTFVIDPNGLKAELYAHAMVFML